MISAFLIDQAFRRPNVAVSGARSASAQARSYLVASWSQILGTQARTLGNPGQHAWPDLFVVVKREHEIGPFGAGERAMGARLTFDHPPDPLPGSPLSWRHALYPNASSVIACSFASSVPI